MQVLDESLPHPGHAQVGQLDQVERINGDLRVREAGGDRFLERGGRVDRYNGDPVPPGLATGVQPALDGRTVAAVDDAEDLPGRCVDQRGHPRLHPPPRVGVSVAEPADPAVAMFVDAEVLNAQGVHVVQHVDRSVDCVLDGPPRHPMVPGNLVDRLTLIDHRSQQRLPQPTRAAGP
jgi:hypothetical protein